MTDWTPTRTEGKKIPGASRPCMGQRRASGLTVAEARFRRLHGLSVRVARAHIAIAGHLPAPVASKAPT